MSQKVREIFVPFSPKLVWWITVFLLNFGLQLTEIHILFNTKMIKSLKNKRRIWKSATDLVTNA